MSEKPVLHSNTSISVSWSYLGRIILKVTLLFLLFNVVFAVTQPLGLLGKISIYNWLVPGRQRLPYGEEPDRSYNLSLNNIPAMVTSHGVNDRKADDEFRVLILGDSGIWGWLLENDHTLAGQITASGLRSVDGRKVVAYNLGYPIMSLVKDLMLLDATIESEPDLIIWSVTLRSFAREKQLDPPIVEFNPDRVRRLIKGTQLNKISTEHILAENGFWDNTILAQRRDLADLLRLQLYGIPWAVTGIDQAMPEEIELRSSDFEEDQSWLSFQDPVQFTDEDLVFEILDRGISLAGNVPLLIVNEPIFISSGQNSHLRYNAWYPRWAYDQYREMLYQYVVENQRNYLDLWDLVGPDQFTDSPVHLTPDGIEKFSQAITESQFFDGD